jgi:hypothetical protein
MKQIALLATAALFFSALAVAGGGLRYDEDADFASFASYAWKKGAPALDERVQQAIVQKVDRELQAKGLERVEEGPDLYVMTYAFGEGQAQTDASLGVWGGDNVYGNENIGVNTTDVRVNTKGTLLVKLVDAGSGETVWESQAQKSLGENVGKALKKIDKMIAKMFERYPPD